MKVGVGIGVGVYVAVGVGEGVWVGVDVGKGVGVSVGVGVGVTHGFIAGIWMFSPDDGVTGTMALSSAKRASAVAVCFCAWHV